MWRKCKIIIIFVHSNTFLEKLLKPVTWHSCASRLRWIKVERVNFGFINFKLTCRHINRRHICFNIKSIPVHPLLRKNVMLDFIYMIFTEMWTTFRKRKIQNDNDNTFTVVNSLVSRVVRGARWKARGRLFDSRRRHTLSFWIFACSHLREDHTNEIKHDINPE